MSDHGDSLMMLIQQHNMKEEQILYSMMDQFLSAQSETLLAKAGEVLGSA
jgi:iron-sulfur cluster repair protein YtfE (RIC family)